MKNIYDFGHLHLEAIVDLINSDSASPYNAEYLSASYCHHHENPNDVTPELIDAHLDTLEGFGAKFDRQKARARAIEMIS